MRTSDQRPASWHSIVRAFACVLDQLTAKLTATRQEAADQSAFMWGKLRDDGVAQNIGEMITALAGIEYPGRRRHGANVAATSRCT